MNVFGTLLAAITLAACGGGAPTGGGDSTQGGDGTSGSDDLAAYEGAISCAEGGADGSATYATLCNGCHSSYAPTLTDIGWSAAQLRRQVRVGSDTMPSFGEDRLSAGDLECMLTHLQGTGAVAGDAAPAEAAPAEAAAPAEG